MSSFTDPKQKFIENVKIWVAADTQLKQLNEKVKKIRDYRTQINKEIITYMEEQKSTHTKIEISDGELKLYEKKEYSPLTFAYIQSCLANIINDESHVEFIIQYLKDHREIKTQTDIRRITKQ